MPSLASTSHPALCQNLEFASSRKVLLYDNHAHARTYVSCTQILAYAQVDIHTERVSSIERYTGERHPSRESKSESQRETRPIDLPPIRPHSLPARARLSGYITGARCLHAYHIRTHNCAISSHAHTQAIFFRLSCQAPLPST